MSSCKLVIVEGIPGSGKTSTAHFVADWLGENGLSPYLFLEGDLDHPADYESTACLKDDEYALLLERFPRQSAELQGLAARRGGEVFLSYRKLQSPPAELAAELARRDVYELPLADWQRVTLARWAGFARAAADEPGVFVFECCFLQNLLTTPLAKFDQPESEAAAHVLHVAGTLRDLCPALIYLDPPNVRATLEKTAANRPQEWLDFVAAYTAGQGWGAARGLSGFDGMVRFYETRRRLEKTLVPALRTPGFSTLWLENAGLDWKADHARIRAFLHTVMDPI